MEHTPKGARPDSKRTGYPGRNLAGGAAAATGDLAGESSRAGWPLSYNFV